MVGPARVGRHFPRGGPKILNVLFGFQRPQRQTRLSSLDIVLLSTMIISPSDLGHVVRDARAAGLRLNQKDNLIPGSFDFAKLMRRRLRALAIGAISNSLLPSSSGLGRGPLKAETRVRFP